MKDEPRFMGSMEENEFSENVEFKVCVCVCVCVCFMDLKECK